MRPWPFPVTDYVPHPARGAVPPHLQFLLSVVLVVRVVVLCWVRFVVFWVVSVVRLVVRFVELLV